MTTLRLRFSLLVLMALAGWGLNAQAQFYSEPYPIYSYTGEFFEIPYPESQLVLTDPESVLQVVKPAEKEESDIDPAAALLPTPEEEAETTLFQTIKVGIARIRVKGTTQLYYVSVRPYVIDTFEGGVISIDAPKDLIKTEGKGFLELITDTPPGELRSLFRAQKLGETRVTAKDTPESPDKLYLINILTFPQYKVAQEIKKEIESNTMRIAFKGNKIILNGEVENDEVMKQAIEVAKRKSGFKVVNMLTVSAPLAVRNNTIKMQRYINARITLPDRHYIDYDISRPDVLAVPEDIDVTDPRIQLVAAKPGLTTVRVNKGESIVTYEIHILDPTSIDEFEAMESIRRYHAELIRRLVNAPKLNVHWVGDWYDPDKARNPIQGKEKDLGTIVLTGEVENELDMRMAYQLASMIANEKVLNFVTVKSPLQVRINIKVVLVQHSKDSNIGLRWYDPANTNTLVNGFSKSVAADSVASQLFSPVFPFFEAHTLDATDADTGLPVFGAGNAGYGASVAAQLNLNKDAASAKILQEPTITVLNGQPGQFIVGGVYRYTNTILTGTPPTPSIQTEEIPFGVNVIVTPLHSLPEFIPGGFNALQYGSTEVALMRTVAEDGRLKNDTTATVQSMIDRNGTIRIYIRPEISSLDFTSGSTDSNGNVIPVQVIRRIETHVAMKDGESLVMGGLFDEAISESIRSVPFLEKIPILGELFKNRTTDDSRNELIFIMTPQIVKGADIEKSEMPNPRMGKTIQYLEEIGVKTMKAKPTRISAGEILIRNREPVPVAIADPVSYNNIPTQQDSEEVVAEEVTQEQQSDTLVEPAPAPSPDISIRPMNDDDKDSSSSEDQASDKTKPAEAPAPRVDVDIQLAPLPQ